MTSTARLFDLDAPDPAVVAVKLLEECASRRRWIAGYAEANPVHAARDRKWAASNGWASEFDDPVIRVRCSEIEALAGAIPAPAPATEESKP